MYLHYEIYESDELLSLPIFYNFSTSGHIIADKIIAMPSCSISEYLRERLTSCEVAIRNCRLRVGIIDRQYACEISPPLREQLRGVSGIDVGFRSRPQFSVSCSVMSWRDGVFV